MLPQKINSKSKINLVHLSSNVEKKDKRFFVSAQKKMQEKFFNVRLFNVAGKESCPVYLSGSEDERITRFKEAMSDADWIVPIYGGTGCEDVVRYLNENDLKVLRTNHPVVNGFSDATYLLNYLYFKLGLITFHYTNVCGLFIHENSNDFFQLISGRKKKIIFYEKLYDWTTGYSPQEKIEGISIGGNISTFKDLLNVSHIKVRSWDKYILFMEDIGLDEEDFHRLIVELEEKGIFKQIKALVVGSFYGTGKNFTIAKYRKENLIFGTRLDLLEYLLEKTIIERIRQNNPLHILKINNFGHHEYKNPIILPIGAKTIIHQNKKIEFIGPFVK